MGTLPSNSILKFTRQATVTKLEHSQKIKRRTLSIEKRQNSKYNPQGNIWGINTDFVCREMYLSNEATWTEATLSKVPVTHVLSGRGTHSDDGIWQNTIQIHDLSVEDKVLVRQKWSHTSKKDLVWNKIWRWQWKASYSKKVGECL